VGISNQAFGITEFSRPTGEAKTRFWKKIYSVMKTIKKYFDFLNEADEVEDMSLSPEEEKEPTGNYSDIKEEVGEMIEKSLKTSDSKTLEDFISAYVREPDETQIEGLINDSDVYDFYLKWRNDIDEILSGVNFYDEVPSEMSCFSLYDYIIKGTKKAIGEIVSIISEESGASEGTETEPEVETPTE